MADNIVHLVLARVSGAPEGVKGISLFIVPKRLVDAQGQLTGERNDVALAGLNHKLGYRGIPNTLLNFGEGKYPVRGTSGAISAPGAAHTLGGSFALKHRLEERRCHKGGQHHHQHQSGEGRL